MKNNVKRFVALMTAATMVAAPCAVSAASATSNSSGILEFDNSTAPAVGNVILPTLTDDTFDFTIDPEDRLNEYRPEIYTNTGSGIYFETVATKGAIELKSDPDAALKIYGKTAGAISDLNTAATVSGGAVTALSTASAFYVWAPKSVGSAEGEYVQLTKTNIEKYFETSDTAITGFKARIGENTTDQKVYTDDEITSPTANVEDYVVVDKSGNITGFQPGIVISTGSAIEAKAASELQIGESETEWANHSDALRIINKSANDITVKAEVTVDVVSGSGLTYEDDYANVASSTAAAISFQIKDVTNSSSAAIVTSGSSIGGAYTADLKAATGSSIHYITGAVDDKTGGDVFKQFVGSSQTSEEIEIQIEAAVSTSSDAIKAWKEYADNLTAETRPAITVVYSFETASGDSEVTFDLAGANWKKTNLELNAPSGVTSISEAWLSDDDVTYTSLAATDFATYDSNGTQTIWVKYAGHAESALYFKFTSGGTTYKVQLW